MSRDSSSAANEGQGEHISLARLVLNAMKAGAADGFQDAARSFFLPVRMGWNLSLLLVRRLRPIIEPAIAAALMFGVLLALGWAAQRLLAFWGL